MNDDTQRPMNNEPAASTVRGTSAHMPDLAWSQVRETVLLLELAAAQIEAAMTDSGTSVDVLTASFTGMAESMQPIRETVAALPEGGTADADAVRQRLLGATDEISNMVHQAIIAFQFYDKLAQRLAHVTHSLGQLSDLVSDQARIFNPQEWVNLQDRIRSRYTTADERTMFESVMRGEPIAEALAKYLAAIQGRSPVSDVELF